jgi:Mor family transcriptional regulator
MRGRVKEIKITQEMIDAVFSDAISKFANPQKAKSVCEMHCTGVTYKEIAKKSKCSEFYIRDCVRKVLNIYRVFIEGEEA